MAEKQIKHARVTPGPHQRGKLPPTLPTGQLPPDDSRLWSFVPKSVQEGERYIQDDTREWFEDQDRKVVIGRSYPTHPRWIVGEAAKTRRASILNDGIVSEVHMLARVSAGLPDMPAWVPARLNVKQQQADLHYRLTKMTRQVVIEKGQQAIYDFAERSPGQFLKWVSGTYVPKQIEHNVEVKPGETMDAETASGILDALATELKRREEEARTLTLNPGDYEAAGDPMADLKAVAQKLGDATGAPAGKAEKMRHPHNRYLSHGLNKVIDLEAVEDIDWEN